MPRKAYLAVLAAMSIILFVFPLVFSNVWADDDHDDDDDIKTRIARGQDIWFKNTYGGEKFFAFLADHPNPQKRIEIGLEEVLTTPREVRFKTWGTINDPDCVVNPDGALDLCSDPNASGVIGIRKFPGPNSTYLFGVSCAACHAGFDPLKPPKDPEEPTWDNIHPTIGNQDLRTGAIFAVNLADDDVRRFMFAAWPRGTVDTSLLFSDNIMNPSVFTAFWNHRYRPVFDVGMEEPQMRNGQGGEDDLGLVVASWRVYTNIGSCFFECVAPAAGAGQPISIDDCRAACPDFTPREDMEDMGAFLRMIRSPKYRGYKDWWKDWWFYYRGRKVFKAHCASCHTMRGKRRKVLSNDEVNPLVADPENATNACRALGTNWDDGHIWAEFSSDIHKARAISGNKGYRTMPLTGIWATSPLLHNQSIGSWPDATASPDERVEVFEEAMWELLSVDREPKINVLPVDVGPFLEGTPLTFVFLSRSKHERGAM